MDVIKTQQISSRPIEKVIVHLLVLFASASSEFYSAPPETPFNSETSCIRQGRILGNTSHKLKQASETDHHAQVTVVKKIADAKLAKDFQAKAQRLAAERETRLDPWRLTDGADPLIRQVVQILSFSMRYFHWKKKSEDDDSSMLFLPSM
ncbi:hypothetical protein DVH24_000187 [Malus domestica]|uniref:Uncharacterized protein n=1 Tax=Malus domestica TaxID=3750 RepID=A0A498IZ93_MALDO|nr:hypothetical protein DVH24_000187 [Malus domestica]